MKASLFIIATLCILAGVLIIGAQPIVFEWFFPIAEEHFSRDRYITLSGQQFLHQFIYFVGILCLLVGGFFYGWTYPRFRFAIREALLTDPACKSTSTILKPINVLIVSSAIGLILIFVFFLLKRWLPWDSLHQEDGFFETVTAINFLLAGSIMGMVTVSQWKKAEGYISVSYLFITLVFFFIGMEEISWGQRIFRWETPLFLAEVNLSNQTNLHNIVSGSERLAMRRLLAPLFFLVLVVGWFLPRRFWPKVYTYVFYAFPHPSLIVLAFLIMVVGLRGDGELFEELTSFFAVFYSVRIWLCLRLRNLESSRHSRSTPACR